MTVVVCYACGEPWQRLGSPAVCPICGIDSFGIAIDTNVVIVSDRNKDEIKGGTGMTIEEIVNDTLRQYKGDEIMLDAFWQWASNPTSMSAGYGVEDNYPYIQKNLERRYGLSLPEAGARVGGLKTECDSLIERVKSMPIETGRQIGEIQDALRAALTTGDYEDLRRQGVLQRLSRVSEETRRALLLFSLLEEVNATVSPRNFTEPRGYYSDYQSEFQAYYNSVYGDTAPILRIAQEIVQSGAYNELFWIPSRGAKSSPEKTLVGAIIPTTAELVTFGTRMMPMPDVPSLLDLYWDKGDFDILRFVDITSHLPYGVITTDEPLPVGVNVPGFMGSYGSSVALSPVVFTETRDYIERMKQQKMEVVRQTLENVLVTVSREIGRDGTLGVLCTGMGEVVWKFEFANDPPLYIYLVPWLTTFSQSLGHSRINLAEKPHVLFVIPYQSQPSLFAALEKHSGFSLKDERWDKSLGLLSDLQRPNEFQLLIGQRHPLLDKIFAEMSKSERIHTEDDSSKTQPPPSVPPEPLIEPRIPLSPPLKPVMPGQLVLGDRVSKDELHTFAQRSDLTEDERREKLTPIASLTYPLATATTHTAIFGTTGSGKSVTTKRLARELVRHQVPVTIIDWHDEYVDLVRELGGIIAVPPTATTKPASGEIPFTWNVLDPLFYSPQVTPEIIEDYIEIVVDLLGHKDLMDLSEPMKGGLTEALRLAYKGNPAPTFREVLGLLNEVATPLATKDALKRRLQRFSGGSLGSIFCNETSFNPESMFAKAMDVRVKHLTADHRSAVGLLTFFLLRQAISHFKRMGEVDNSALVRHVIIIDEAPMVIGSNPKVEREIVRMLQEVRKFGEGLILVCRNPGISDDILRETNQKIAHKLDVQKDVSSVANMLGIDAGDSKLLHSLPRGVAFARIGGNPTVLVRVKAG